MDVRENSTATSVNWSISLCHRVDTTEFQTGKVGVVSGIVIVYDR